MLSRFRLRAALRPAGRRSLVTALPTRSSLIRSRPGGVRGGFLFRRDLGRRTLPAWALRELREVVPARRAHRVRDSQLECHPLISSATRRSRCRQLTLQLFLTTRRGLVLLCECARASERPGFLMCAR